MQTNISFFLAPLRDDLRQRLFGSASWNHVLPRMAVDFVVANTVLIVAALLRLIANGDCSLADPLGPIAERVNSVYLMNAAWFGVTTIGLLALFGLYRPMPSARLADRLWTIAKACVVGLSLHWLWGTLFLGRALPTLEIGIPAWSVLFGALTLVRVSRMSMSSMFRVVPRADSVVKTNCKVEDVLVVGGAGYVGAELCRQLLSAGYRVRVLDLQLFGLKPLEDIMNHRRLEVINGDFRNIEHVVRALSHMDAVVHLAAIVGDPACAIDEETTIAVNYHAAKMMAQMARAKSISRFVFASTCSVYGAGDANGIIDEHGELNPVSLYATTKIDAEQALRETADDVFQPTMLRFGTAYGLSHRPRFDLVANLFSAQAVTDKAISVFNGHYSRPFVHVRDMARAIVKVLEAPLHVVGNEVFNVGDETQNYTISQLGDMVARLAPGTTVTETHDESDPRSYRVSFDRIRSKLGFRASIDLVDGVREMVDAVRDGRIGNWRDQVYSNQLHMKHTGLKLLKFPTGEPNVDEEMPATTQFLRRAA